MVPFYNLMTVSREEIMHRRSNIWPRLHPDCARVQVTSLTIESSMTQKMGGGGEVFIISLTYFVLISTLPETVFLSERISMVHSSVSITSK
jgi:hypothetical protein